MNEAIESVGAVITGGLIARSAEPGAGEDGSGEEGGLASACLNCGTALADQYCHHCGQKAIVHRSLSAIWHDIAHGALHFEGKIWRTLPLLAWRPGELTRRYIAGERARFVSPMALFLFSVFLMFAIFSAVGSRAYQDKRNYEADAQSRLEARGDFDRDNAKDVAALNRMIEERALKAAAGEPTADIDADIGKARNQIELRKRIFNQTQAMIGTKPGTSKTGGSDNEADNAGEASEQIVVVTGANSVNEWANDAYKKAKQNPALLIYKLQSNGYKFSWALIPISVPFVWLLFLHRRRYRQYKVYDHTVFVTYSIAFMSLGAIAYTLLKLLGMIGTLALLPMLVPPFHMYRQLRGAYHLTRLSALWRTFMLLIFASLASSLFLTLLLTLGLLG